ncbi:MAG: 3alpha(or 20beta)-hydroxysteroid dehydrogenase [Acidimicrobiales bacterium]|jgi:3alpha(or 20beta)-hydroxysteroid dehydrogenase
MTGRVEGKVTLITGAAQGQGEAEARLFAAEGATVVMTDVNAALGEAVAADIGATFLTHDVSSAADWATVMERVVADHGQLDGLVNNAAIFERNRLVDTTEDQLRRMLDINVMSVFFGMQAAAPVMTEAAGGSIVNISSVAGLRGAPGSFAYGASKFAVTGMTKTASYELGAQGIRVNSIHPGFIDTAMLPDNQKVRDNMTKLVPLGRVAEAEEVARLALFLVSDDSSYTTGSEYVVDGGLSAV